MSGYKLKILKNGGWSRYSTVRLGISVGQPYHEGEKLEATLQWVRSRFNKVSIVVADTLQRHNIQSLKKISSEQAYCESKQEGEGWLQRNFERVASLQDVTIIRWDQLLQDPDYQGYKTQAETLFATYWPAKESLHHSIVNYLARQGLGPDYATCETYVKEEVAAFMMMQDKEPCSDLYPGSILPVWDHLGRSDFSFTRVDFVRVKSQALEQRLAS